jgi:putative colanic acid biosynthesis acetyltransferase WcaB
VPDVQANRIGAVLRADWRANPGEWRSRLILTLFRLAQHARRQPRLLWLLALPIPIAYKFLVEWVLTVDLPIRTDVGPGLTLDHAYGIVVHPDAVIGSACVLIQGVTIGRRAAGEAGVPVIGDGVSFGANSVALGSITIGDGARIGAGAVVLQDVPAGATAVGVPARVLGARPPGPPG